jgi:hypothetical protein
MDSHRLFFVHSSNRAALSEHCGGASPSWVKEGERTWVALLDVTTFTSAQNEQARSLSDLIVPPAEAIRNEATPGIVDIWPDRYNTTPDGATRTWKYRNPPGQPAWTSKTKASEIYECIRKTIHTHTNPPTHTTTMSIDGASTPSAAASAARALTAAIASATPPMEAIQGFAANDAFGHSVLRVQVLPAHYCAFLQMCGRLGLQTKTKTAVPTGTLHVKVAADSENGATGAAIVMRVQRLQDKLMQLYPNCVFAPVKRGPLRTPPPTRQYEVNVLVNATLRESDAYTESIDGITVTVSVRGGEGASRTETRRAVDDAIRDAEMGHAGAFTAPKPTTPEVKESLDLIVKRFKPLKLDSATIAAFSKVYLGVAPLLTEPVAHIITKPSELLDLIPDPLPDSLPPDFLSSAEVKQLRTVASAEPPAIDVRQPQAAQSRKAPTSSAAAVSVKKKPANHPPANNNIASRIMNILRSAPTLSQAKGRRTHVPSSAVRGNRGGQNSRRSAAARR